MALCTSWSSKRVRITTCKKGAAVNLSFEQKELPISTGLPYSTRTYVCCFSCKNQDQMVAAFKKYVDKSKTMTGETLCALLGEDYAKVLEWLDEPAEENTRFIVEYLMTDQDFAVRAAPHVEPSILMSDEAARQKMRTWLSSPEGKKLLMGEGDGAVETERGSFPMVFGCDSAPALVS